MRVRWRWVLVGLVAAAGIGGYAVSQRPLPVETVKVRRGEAVEVFYATGFVETEEPVEVASRITAPIVSVNVAEGARVVRRQVLATLDAGEQRQALTQLAAQTRNAQAAANRTLAVFKTGFATAAARDRDVAALASARAAEAAARERLGQYTLRAGISGVVLRRDAEPGDLATPSKTLFVLGDPAQLKVTATVDERDIPRVVTGQPALMSSDAFPGRIFKGSVRELTPGGDPTQRAFRVRIRPEGDFRPPVGLTLEINIETGRKANALLAPAAAIKDGHVLLVENGRVKRTAVTTGVTGGEATEIVHGLADGACLIAKPDDKLADGRRVRASDC